MVHHFKLNPVPVVCPCGMVNALRFTAVLFLIPNLLRGSTHFVDGSSNFLFYFKACLQRRSFFADWKNNRIEEVKAFSVRNQERRFQPSYCQVPDRLETTYPGSWRIFGTRDAYFVWFQLPAFYRSYSVSSGDVSPAEEFPLHLKRSFYRLAMLLRLAQAHHSRVRWKWEKKLGDGNSKPNRANWCLCLKKKQGLLTCFTKGDLDDGKNHWHTVEADHVTQIVLVPMRVKAFSMNRKTTEETQSLSQYSAYILEVQEQTKNGL